MNKFIFCTGIENSDPFVNGIRRDLMEEAHNFYENYEERLENIASLGIKYLRLGAPYSRSHILEEVYDFSFMDKFVSKCKELGIEIISDLIHFGLPEWMHKEQEESFFQNKIFPNKFAKYAGEFCKRYPEIKYFGLINEPFVTAYFSTKLGIWNESIKTNWKDDKNFVIASKNIAKAVILAKKEIEKIYLKEKRKNSPIFIQTESFELALCRHSSRKEEVKRFNLRKFCCLDLILGEKYREMKKYLLSQGLTKKEYNWFMKNASKKNFILGIDHYPTCVHKYYKSKIINNSPEEYNLYFKNIVKEYYSRYKIKILHTEVNAWPSHAKKIFNETLNSLKELIQEKLPILGMSWFGDEYQIDWHNLLIKKTNIENPVGIFYKGKKSNIVKNIKNLLNNT